MHLMRKSLLNARNLLFFCVLSGRVAQQGQVCRR